MYLQCLFKNLKIVGRINGKNYQVFHAVKNGAKTKRGGIVRVKMPRR